MIRNIEAAGDHYEVGRALGRAAADALHDVVPGIGRFRDLQNEWMGSERLRALEAAARSTFPQYVRELEGIADGAGVAFERVFLWNCRGDIPLGGDQSPAEVEGCTTVQIPGPHGGIIAHNEDDQAELDGHCWLARIRTPGEPAFSSFYSPGLLPGHTFAVNEAGLVQTINHIRPRDQRPGIPRHVICRAVLACRDLEAALALLSRSDRASGFHHNLARAGETRLLSVEAPASGCEVSVATFPRAHANHLLSDAFPSQRQEITPSSARRQRRAETLIANGALDGGDPLAVLTDRADRDYPILRKTIGGVDTGYTLATAVFEVAGRGVTWRIHADATAAPEHEGHEGL